MILVSVYRADFFYFLQAVDLMKYKGEIFSYVESRMSFIAPNISIIVGASTAAKIMGRYCSQLISTWWCILMA